jgi:ketosteroid isomerase-like protein
MDDVLRRLLAESEIRLVLAHYARAIDRMDFELVRTCYHADAVDEHGWYDGGVDGYIAFLRESLPRSDATFHMLGNPLIEVEGDVARTETYCLVWNRSGAGDRLVQVRYCDRFERRDAGWRIAHRRTVYGPGRLDPVETEAPMPARFHAGTRDVQDASYR